MGYSAYVEMDAKVGKCPSQNSGRQSRGDSLVLPPVEVCRVVLTVSDGDDNQYIQNEQSYNQHKTTFCLTCVGKGHFNSPAKERSAPKRLLQQATAWLVQPSSYDT
jgi:hypothetical protein